MYRVYLAIVPRSGDVGSDVYGLVRLEVVLAVFGFLSCSGALLVCYYSGVFALATRGALRALR